MLKDNNRLFYYVYKITNTINGKIYIGVHKTDNLEDSYMGSGTLIKRSIKKHGVENFIKEYIQFFDDYQSCLDLEELLVTEAFIASPHNYNIKGGEVFGNVFAGKSIKGNKWYHNPETRDIKCFPENSQPEGFLIGRGSST